MKRVRTSIALVAAPFAVLAASAAPVISPLSMPPSAEVATPARPDDTTPAGQAYRRGIERLVAKDLDGAEAAFREALKLNPRYANAMLGLAEVAVRKKRVDESEKLIRDAIKAEPANASAYASLGRLQVLRRQFQEGEVSLKKAAELDPKMVRARMDLAATYAAALRKPKEAVALYREVLAIAPGHVPAHYAVGVLQAALGEVAQGRQSLETAQRLEPRNPAPALALARLDISAKNFDSAAQRIDSVIAMHPNLPEALDARGDIWQLRRSPEKALADYEAVLKAHPTRASTLLKRAMVLQQLDRKDAAAESYQAVIKHNPRAALAYNNLAWMAAESGKNLEQAEAWSRKAIELAPKAPEFHGTLGWVQRSRGDAKSAEKSLLHAVSLKGARASTFYYLGVVQAELGKKGEAASAYKKALAIDKSHAAAAAALRRLGSP